jgi:hypothetical protein
MTGEPITWTARCPGCGTDARWTAHPHATGDTARLPTIDCKCGDDDLRRVAAVITGRAS